MANELISRPMTIASENSNNVVAAEPHDVHRNVSWRRLVLTSILPRAAVPRLRLRCQQLATSTANIHSHGMRHKSQLALACSVETFDCFLGFLRAGRWVRCDSIRLRELITAQRLKTLSPGFCCFNKTYNWIESANEAAKRVHTEFRFLAFGFVFDPVRTQSYGIHSNAN